MSYKIPEIEKQVLSLWNDDNTFQKSLDQTKDKPIFTFYDGPPFATGLPHYGHIVASTIKDIVPRYKTMTGFYVPRRFGWDTHGLPIEFEIEKKLGIKTRQEVLDMGIDKYNEECRSIVMKYSTEWRQTIQRLGRWVDMDNDYKTMDVGFMESVWWVFKQLWNKDLVYEGTKVMPYSAGCGTPLSNFEARSAMKSVSDPSVVVKFPLIKESNEYFLVWTTTPWTLPSNLALCVHPEYEYSLIKVDDNNFWLMTDAIGRYFADNEYHVIDQRLGKDLVDLKYKPLYNFYSESGQYPFAYKVVCDKYVDNLTGTGIVHQAPAFGEDDARVCEANDILTKEQLPPCPFDANGLFTSEFPSWKGMFFKDADKLILKELKEQKLVFKSGSETHSYPFCWRSGTPLMYRAVPCIFVNVEKIKTQICENNQKINWIPSHIKDGRFGNWLKDARDWCISRNRFWGTPIPIWRGVNSGRMLCIGSIAELEQYSGVKVVDLHRHHIDKITFEYDGDVYKRVDEVFDCWFESGSMPYAQNHYPFDEKLNAEFQLPADFIAEGLDQTRGWFYTLLILSTALFNKPAFSSVIVNGLVLAEDGEKMSKSKKNYPDPQLILDKYGADALRLYLISNTIVRGDDMKFKEDGVKDIIKSVHQFALNSVDFLKQMVELFKVNYKRDFPVVLMNYMAQQNKNVMDRMILNYLQEFVSSVHSDMEKYQLFHIVDNIKAFIDKLSRLYLNMNKTRMKRSDNKTDCLFALNTLMYCLKVFSTTIAPFAPFMAEYIYQECKKIELHNDNIPFKSVHLERINTSVWNSDVEMVGVLPLLEMLIQERQDIRANILKTAKKPISKQIVLLKNEGAISVFNRIKETLEAEWNVLELEFVGEFDEKTEFNVNPNVSELGKKFKKDAKYVKEYIGNMNSAEKENMYLELNVKGEYILNGKYTLTENDVLFEYGLKRLALETIGFKKPYVKVGGEYVVVSELEWTDELENLYECKILVRKLMDMRKDMGLKPVDVAYVEYPEENEFVKRNLELLESKTNMSFKEVVGTDDVKISVC